MDEATLAGYLDDHLAGSEAGLRTAERLTEEHGDGDVGVFMTRFRGELEQERDELRAALDRLGVDESLFKRGVGVAGGVVGWARDRLPLEQAPSLLEDLEGLAVGVWGKRLLWGTLARVAVHDGRFRDFDLDRLATQAEEQERGLLALRADEIERSLRLGAQA